ncbi:MAG: hypothetical protein QW520_00195 [Methanomassiliicoccales archaeon]
MENSIDAKLELRLERKTFEYYSSHLICVGGTWNLLKYVAMEKLPFIPTESEIDHLIVRHENKTSAFLQLLEKQAQDVGEAWQFKWTDIDIERNTVGITLEKHNNSRTLKIFQCIKE